MKLREHRGSLDNSMETVIEIPATMQALEKAINNALSQFIEVSSGMIHVEPYGFDNRINWNTHIVTIDGYGVFGFTDEPLVSNAEITGSALLRSPG